MIHIIYGETIRFWQDSNRQRNDEKCFRWQRYVFYFKATNFFRTNFQKFTKTRILLKKQNKKQRRAFRRVFAVFLR